MTRVDRSGGPQSCWNYTGNRDPQGRPQDHSLEVTYGLPPGVYRAIMVLLGRLPMNSPREVQVMHAVCDNPSCCNPRHLQIGTAGENARDCADKGRHGRGYSWISEEDRAQILARFSKGESVSELAKAFGRTTAGIYGLLHRSGIPRIRHRSAKLTQDQVACIMAERKNGDTLKVIASRHGVSLHRVSVMTRHLNVRRYSVVDRKAALCAELAG